MNQFQCKKTWNYRWFFKGTSLILNSLIECPPESTYGNLGDKENDCTGKICGDFYFHH